MDKQEIQQKAKTLLKDVVSFGGDEDSTGSAEQKWTKELNNLSPAERLAVALEMKRQREQIAQKHPGLLPPLHIETGIIDGVEQLTNIRKDEQSEDSDFDQGDLYDRPGQVIDSAAKDRRAWMVPPTDEQLAQARREFEQRKNALWKDREESLKKSGMSQEQARLVVGQERAADEKLQQERRLEPEESISNEDKVQRRRY